MSAVRSRNPRIIEPSSSNSMSLNMGVGRTMNDAALEWPELTPESHDVAKVSDHVCHLLIAAAEDGSMVL